MLLKNSLSGETGTRAENIDLHNRAIFNDLVSGKVSPYPEKIRVWVFQQNRRSAEVRFWVSRNNKGGLLAPSAYSDSDQLYSDPTNFIR